MVAAYQDYELAEYMATMAMGSLGGAVGAGGSKGRGNLSKQTVTSNKGKTINVTPNANRTTTSVSNPAKGTPNSSVDIIDKKIG